MLYNKNVLGKTKNHEATDYDNIDIDLFICISEKSKPDF